MNFNALGLLQKVTKALVLGRCTL